MLETDVIALEHSSLLTGYIANQIHNNDGQISFAKFMQEALYAPNLGYYNAGAIKFGQAGDFITAPELGSLFAQCLSKQCEQIFAKLKARNILEFGAGSGKLACDLLTNLQLDNYYILEVSADLQQRQRQLIATQCPEHAHKVHWLDSLPNTFSGIIIANEVLDAMPVARFYFANDLLQEHYVSYNGENFFTKLGAASNKLTQAFKEAKLSSYLPQPYSSEVNLWLSAWIKSLNACITSGAIILCDYGFPRAEYYHPERNHGTLMCHYKHRCHDNPFINIGLQDITAHVDFTAIAIAADASSLNVAGYTNLASFLLNCDVTKFFTPGNLKQAQELQILTSPAEMGELFKVIALTKNFEMDLLGFEYFDKRHTL